MCSDSEHKVYHHHSSSQQIRDFAVKHTPRYLFQCIMCKVEESVMRPRTRKIILTDSSLYDVWSSESLKLPIHIDIEAVVGGRVRDLTRALIMMYLRFPERVEVILVGGLNNVGENQGSREIVEEMQELKATIDAHSKSHGHEVPSVLSISTLLYAPKFCSLDVPPGDKYSEWVPPPNFNNRRSTIEEVNAAAKEMNLKEKVNYLKLHQEGIRIDTKTGKTLHKHFPEKPVWREPEVRKRLHLTLPYKVNVTLKAAKMFAAGLQNIGDWGKPANL